MTKSEPPYPLPGHSREVVYATIIKGDSTSQSLDFVSDSVKSVLGYSPDELSKKRGMWNSLIHPGDLKQTMEGWRVVVDSGVETTLTYRMKLKESKKYIWLEDRTKPRLNREGKIIGVVGSAIDITERRELEDALRESDARLHSIFDNSSVGIYRTTPDGKILLANRALVEMLGYDSFEELSTKNLNKSGYQPGYPRSLFQARIESNERIKGFESAWTRKNGEALSVRESAHVVRDREGNVMYYEGTVEDISDQKKVEAKAAQINKTLRLLSKVSKLVMYEATRDSLFDKACEMLVADGGYRLAWIGILDDSRKVIMPLASSGEEKGYLDVVRISADDRPEGNGPAGKAVRSGEVSVCNDVETDPSFESWRSEALKRSFRAVASFPMHVRGTVVGVLSVYSGTKGGFGPEETHLLSELADDIGFAVWAIEARSQQEAADEVIRDRGFWLNESQRVARVGSFVYEVKSGTWTGSPVLDDLVGIDQSYKRNFRSWLNLIYPEDRADLLSKVESSIPHRKQFNAEFRIVRASDKELRWMWGTSEVLLDSSGKPVRLFGTVQDITERIRMEEELRNERILLRTLVDNLPNSIYVKDKNYRKVLANPTNVRRASMASEAGVLGKTDFELYPREIAERFFEDDRRVIERGEAVIDREEFVFDENGNKRWQVTSKIPLRDEKGSIAGLIGIGTDITERKLAEEEKQRERVLLKTLFDHLPASIWVKDKDYKRTAINRTNVARIALLLGRAGMSESDFLGKTDFEVYDRERAENYFLDDQRVIRDGKTVLDREEMVVDSKGVKHWQLVSKVPLFDEGGSITGLIGIITDITKQKEAEQAQERERTLLRTLIDHLPNAVFVKDKELRKLIANRAHIHRVGVSTGKTSLSESDVIGGTDFDVYPEEMARKYQEEDDRILREGKAVIGREDHGVDADGRERWELISKIPLRDETGEISGIVGITSDITGQKAVEETLRRERILLKTILDHIPNAIFAKDTEFRKILVNPAHVERMSEQIGPHAAEELLGKSDFDVCPPAMAEEYLRDDRKIIRDGKSILNKPVLEIDNNGLKHWELISKIPMRDEKGEIIGLVGVSTDITALREAEERLTESEAKFRLLAENARDIVYRYALIPSPHFEYVSPSATVINGYTPEEHYGDPELFFKIVHPENLSVIKESTRGGMVKDSTVAVRWTRKDGSQIWVEMQNHPVFARDGTPVAVEGIIRDITERKNSEEALRKSEETMARITGSIRDAIYSIDGKTGEFEYLSPAFEKLFGYSASDIKAMGGRWPFLRTVIQGEHEATPDPVVNDMQRGKLKSPPVWERWWRCKDGSRLFIEDYSVPTYDGDRLVRVDGVLRDITERKLAEEEVERERVLLRTLIDNFPYAIYVKDRNFRKVIANPIDVKNFAGLSSEREIIGKTDFDLYPKEIAERLQADDRKVIIDGLAIIGREELVVDARGKEHWLLTTKVPLRDKENKIVGLVGVGIDVTEKRTVDEALRQSEAELRALFESMNDVIMAIDAEGRYLKIAPTDPTLLYRPAEEMLGKTFHDVLPRDMADRFLSVVRATLATGKTHSIEYMMKIGGSEKWRAASVSPMTDNSVIWVARDITERKEMEREITDSEKKYRELVENALVGVYKINLSGSIVYANKAMADMLEYDSPKKMMSVSSSAIYRNVDEMQSFVEELRTYGKTGKSKEVELVTKTGKVRNVLLSASLDRDVISGMAKDITEIRTLERQFLQTQKLEGLGNIAAGIAHDFNNILGVIVGYSDLLGQSAYDPAKFDRGMQAISKAADRGKSLVRQLLTFARKTEVTFEPFMLNNAVTEIERLVAETFPRTVEVHTRLNSGLPMVLADATQIHQVLLNLCVNARDAMPKGGKLTLSTGVVAGSDLSSRHPEAASGAYVEVQVSDTGTGMDEATRQRIFEPFYTTKGIGKGTGLGLSVVYGIVESHRGFIDVTSELGAGTTFSIYLPALEHPVEHIDMAEEGSEDRSGEGTTILVIEDEEMLRELLRSILNSKGYKVLIARDGEEGVDIFRKNIDRVALVISDLGLPKLSGEEVVGRILEISGKVKVAIASGFIDPEVKSEMEKEGIAHFIQKPYKMSEVLRVVNEILGGI